MYQPSDPPNFDDMSDDAAATEFELTLGDLINNTAGTPEDVAASVDGLLETLNNFLTKASTLDDMVAYVFDSAAGGQVIHYAASNFLAHLAEKFTRGLCCVGGRLNAWLIGWYCVDFSMFSHGIDRLIDWLIE